MFSLITYKISRKLIDIYMMYNERIYLLCIPLDKLIRICTCIYVYIFTCVQVPSPFIQHTLH